MEYTNSEMRALIGEHIHSERDRGILCRRMIDGLTYERLADEFQMSPRQVREIVHKHEPILRKKMP